MIFRNIKLEVMVPCLLAIVIDVFGYGLVYPIMTAIFTNPSNSLVSSLHSETLRNFFMGLSYMLYPLGMLFGASFMGDLSDHFGRKKVIALCMGGICLSFILMGFGVIASSLSILLIGRALSGLMAGSQPIAQAAISDLSTPETKALNMSMITFVICIGLVLGPLLGGVFSDPSLFAGFGFDTPFFIAAALSGIAALWILISFKETFVPTKKKPLSLFRPIEVFIDAFRHREVRALVIIFLLMQVGFGLYFQTILIQIKQLFSYTSLYLGLFTGFMGLYFAFGTLVIIPLALKKWNVSRMAIGALILTGGFQLWGGANQYEALSWILAFPIALFDIIAYAMLMTTFSNAATKEEQGWVMGIFGATVAISFALVGLSTNLLQTTGTQGLIIGGGVLLILSGVGMAWYQRAK